MWRRLARKTHPLMWLAVLALATVPSVIRCQETVRPTTVILVRHAEKSAPEGDFPLSSLGRSRAKELARVLGDAPLAAIYTTQFLRTQETAQPLADRLHLKIEPLVATATYVQDLIERIRSEHVGETVLVVSHRNTVPAIIEALGATPVPTLTEEQYDHMYIVTVTPAGGVTMLELRFGRPTH